MQRCTLHFDGVRCADFQTPTSVVPVLDAFSYPTMTITLADTVMIILTSILDLAVCQILAVVVSSVGSDADICMLCPEHGHHQAHTHSSQLGQSTYPYLHFVTESKKYSRTEQQHK